MNGTWWPLQRTVIPVRPGSVGKLISSACPCPATHAVSSNDNIGEYSKEHVAAYSSCIRGTSAIPGGRRRIIRRPAGPVKHAPRDLLLLRSHDDEPTVEARVDVAETGGMQRPDDPIRRESQLTVKAFREAPAPIHASIHEVVDLDGGGLELQEAREDHAVVTADGDEAFELFRLDREVTERRDECAARLERREHVGCQPRH